MSYKQVGCGFQLCERRPLPVRGDSPVHRRQWTHGSSAQPLVPRRRISSLVDAGIAKRQAASEYLKELVDIGVLQEQKAGREKLFINPRLMRLLTTESAVVPPFEKSRKRR